MRINRLLHCIRLARSRAPAQAIIAGGPVRIDGKRALKPDEERRPGRIMALPLRGRVLVLEVLARPIRRGPAGEARAAYQEVGVDEAAPRS